MSMWKKDMHMQEYSYYYEGARFYCYPDCDVLINKFGLKDEKKLDEIERAITFAKSADYKRNPIKGVFDFKHYCKIHKFLFEDIYEWAGKEREGGFMSKGNTVFTKSEYIEFAFGEYYKEIKKDKCLKGLDKETFCEKLAYYMSEVNTIHPFREGNGRTQRLYFRYLCRKAGYNLEFHGIHKNVLINADIAAFNREYEPLIKVLDKVASKSQE